MFYLFICLLAVVALYFPCIPLYFPCCPPRGRACGSAIAMVPMQGSGGGGHTKAGVGTITICCEACQGKHRPHTCGRTRGRKRRSPLEAMSKALSFCAPSIGWALSVPLAGRLGKTRLRGLRRARKGLLQGLLSRGSWPRRELPSARSVRAWEKFKSQSCAHGGEPVSL